MTSTDCTHPMMDEIQGCIVMDAHFLSKKNKRELRDQLKLEKNKTYSDRIRIILLSDEGWSNTDISDAFLLSRKTVYNCKEKYFNHGIEGLLNDNYHGKKFALSEIERSELGETLKKTFFKSVSEIIDYVDKNFGIKYSPSGMKYLLHKMGFSFKKPKGVPAKANKQSQKKFSTRLKKIITRSKTSYSKKSASKSVVYFTDAAHPTYGTALKSGWIKKGEEFWIKTPSGRERLNIQGAVCPITLDVIARNYITINQFSVHEFLEEIRKKHPDLKTRIHLILDNASYYRAKSVAKIAKSLNINLIFIPPYSPNLNLIERLWKFMRKKVFTKYYETFKDLEISVKKFFQYIRKYKKDLNRIIRVNFQILDKSLAQ